MLEGGADSGAAFFMFVLKEQQRFVVPEARCTRSPGWSEEECWVGVVIMTQSPERAESFESYATLWPIVTCAELRPFRASKF